MLTLGTSLVSQEKGFHRKVNLLHWSLAPTPKSVPEGPKAWVHLVDAEIASLAARQKAAGGFQAEAIFLDPETQKMWKCLSLCHGSNRNAMGAATAAAAVDPLSVRARENLPVVDPESLARCTVCTQKMSSDRESRWRRDERVTAKLGGGGGDSPPRGGLVSPSRRLLLGAAPSAAVATAREEKPEYPERVVSLARWLFRRSEAFVADSTRVKKEAAALLPDPGRRNQGQLRALYRKLRNLQAAHGGTTTASAVGVTVDLEAVAGAEMLAKYYASQFSKRDPFPPETCRILCWLAMGLSGSGRVSFARLEAFAGWPPSLKFKDDLTRVCRLLDTAMTVPLSEQENRLAGAFAELPHLLSLFPQTLRAGAKGFVLEVVKGLQLDSPSYFDEGTQLEARNLRDRSLHFQNKVYEALRPGGSLSAAHTDWSRRVADLASAPSAVSSIEFDKLLSDVSDSLSSVSMRQAALHREEQVRTGHVRAALCLAVHWLGCVARNAPAPRLLEPMAAAAEAVLANARDKKSFCHKVSISEEVRGIFCQYPLLRGHMHALARRFGADPARAFALEDVTSATVSRLCGSSGTISWGVKKNKRKRKKRKMSPLKDNLVSEKKRRRERNNSENRAPAYFSIFRS
jgi:hypothetical protein